MNLEEKQKKKLLKKAAKLERKDEKWKTRYGVSLTEVKENVKTKKNRGFPKFKEFLFRYKSQTKLYVLFFLFGLIISTFALYSPVLTEKLINELTFQNWDKAMIFALLYIIVGLVTSLLQDAFSLFGTKLNNNISHFARMDVLKNLTKTKVQKFDTTSSGEIITRGITDANSVSNSIGQIIRLFTYALGFFMYIIYTLYLNFWLGFILLLNGLLSLITQLIYLRKFQKNYSKRNIMINEKTMSQQTEMIRGIRDVKFLGIAPSIVQTFKQTSMQKNNSILDNTKARNLLSIINTVRNLAFLAIFLIVGIKFMQNSIVSLSVFLVIFMYRSNITNFFHNVNSLVEEMQTAEIHAERMMQIFDEEAFPKEEFGNEQLKNIKGKIEFKNVSFAYDDKHNVIENLSFTINPNECVAFVGKSGQGKSTIASLIPKLYEITSGKILLDGKKLTKLNENSIRNNISVVQQMPYIFNISIKENLLYAKQDATDEEIVTALKNAQLYDFVCSLPDNFNTIVGEGGIKLSGGQRQRLSIARAFLQNRKIIIFDEATSALDNENQSKIQDAIKLLKQNKTIIIIAHRLSTVKDCDKIFVLDDKKIVENGTHTELMKTSKIYKTLYKSEDV